MIMIMPQSSSLRLPLMNLVKLKGVPFLKQLHLEERLLQTSSDNWCIINDGTNSPTNVMGISGKPAELLEIHYVLRDKVPVIRRFTGGGTVIVDSGTIFVTFICNKDDVPAVQPYPQPIMSWSSLSYSKVFQGVGDFNLRENADNQAFSQYPLDYVFGSRKFGGNAQSITKNRWIHHTSFLGGYEINNMAHLKVPKKARSHLDFICCMKDYLPRSYFITGTVDTVGNHFSIRSTELGAVKLPPNMGFAHSSKLLTEEELEEAAFKSYFDTYLPNHHNGSNPISTECGLLRRQLSNPISTEWITEEEVLR